MGTPDYQDGAGILVYNGHSNSTVTIDNCKITGNTAIGHYGGGIDANFLETLIIENSSITSNTVTYGGAGLLLDNVFNAQIISSQIKDNQAAYGSIADLQHNTTLSISQSIIFRNNFEGLELLDGTDSLILTNNFMEEAYTSGTLIDSANALLYLL